VTDYRITYKQSVAKELRKLDRSQLKSVIKRIASLAANPRPVGCIRLQGGEGLYRVRQGDYRILYRIDDDILVVLVVKVGHRREVYGRS
jgi:mRNA interferase RelE/StbE